MSELSQYIFQSPCNSNKLVFQMAYVLKELDYNVSFDYIGYMDRYVNVSSYAFQIYF